MPSEGRCNSTSIPGSPLDHRAIRLLAALEPDDFALLEPRLEAVILPCDTVLYEPGDPIGYTYFPHDAVVSLVDVMADGRLAEVAMFGRESLFGLLTASVSREAFGRYVVQIPGSASRIPLERMHAALRMRPSLQRRVLAYNEALLAQAYHTVACNAPPSVPPWVAYRPPASSSSGAGALTCSTRLGSSMPPVSATARSACASSDCSLAPILSRTVAVCPTLPPGAG
jgi:hypothetical protein